MGDFGYIFGFACFFCFLIGCLVGWIAAKKGDNHGFWD